MPQITHAVVDPVGGSPVGVRSVEVAIQAPRATARVYRASDGAEVNSPELVTYTTSGGVYPSTLTLDLIPNEDLIPAGTRYAITLHLEGDAALTRRQPTTFVVPDGAGPYRLVDLLDNTASDTGAVVVGFTPAGTYSAGTTYYLRHVVEHEGSSYVARGTTTGVTPGTNASVWQLLAQGGDGRHTSMPVRFENTSATLLSSDRGRIVAYDAESAPASYTLPSGAANGDVYIAAQTWTGPLTVYPSADANGIRVPGGGIGQFVELPGQNTVMMFVRDAGSRWLSVPFGAGLSGGITDTGPIVWDDATDRAGVGYDQADVTAFSQRFHVAGDVALDGVRLRDPGDGSLARRLTTWPGEPWRLMWDGQGVVLDSDSRLTGQAVALYALASARPGGTAQSVPANSEAAIDFTHVEYNDAPSIFVVDLATNTITVQGTGLYLLTWRASHNGTAGERDTFVQRNGAYFRDDIRFSINGEGTRSVYSALVRLTASDVLQMRTWVETTCTIGSTVSTETGWEIAYLGA